MSAKRGLAIAGLAALVCAACTPMRSRIAPPYELEGRTYDERQIREIAAERCTKSGAPLPTHPFTTDGCSAWPDDGYRHCCIAHDLRYWCGGDSEQRRRADRELHACVRGDSSVLNSRVMLWGVRAGGGRLMPFPWRWGYGYSWPYRKQEAAAETPVGAPGRTD